MVIGYYAKKFIKEQSLSTLFIVNEEINKLVRKYKDLKLQKYIYVYERRGSTNLYCEMKIKARFHQA